MLILSRRIGETLTIGDEVTVTVVGVRDSRVSFGINAPKEVPVHREEIYHKLAVQKEMAAQADATESELAASAG